jgi:hypothetical protein
MGSVKTLNPNAEVMGRNAALFMNINAAKGLYEVMKTNFGPKGTIKMLVGGAGGALHDKATFRLLLGGREAPNNSQVACRRSAQPRALMQPMLAGAAPGLLPPCRRRAGLP